MHGRENKVDFGVPLVRDRATAVFPFGVEMTLPGTPEVKLQQRYVYPESFWMWGLEYERFGYYANVYNRDCKLLANGFVHVRFGRGTTVTNGARALNPRGEVMTLALRNHFEQFHGIFAARIFVG